MYNATTLKAGLIGLVGWRQNPDPAGEELTTLTASSSGMFFNDEHPLLTFDNLLSLSPEFPPYTYDAWSAITTYLAGDIVASGGEYYIAIAGSLNQVPPNATYWQVFNSFNQWLKEKTEAGIIRAIQGWLDRKFEVKTARNLLERQQMFTTAPSMEITDASEGKLVGFEFTPARTRGVKLTIEKIGLQLTVNQSLTVRLFKSDSVTPVQSQVLEYTAGGGQQWFAVNWELPGEGSYYVAYLQGDLSGEAIRGILDYNYQNAGYSYFPVGRYFDAVAFKTEPDGATLWNIADNEYTVSTNYGLNFRLNVQCDYTDFILEQKDLFKTVIAKQVASDLLRELAYNANVRVNRNESNISLTQILYEIDGDSQGRRAGGIKKQLEDAFAAISFDTKGLDGHCLPCRKRSVNYRSI